MRCNYVYILYDRQLHPPEMLDDVRVWRVTYDGPNAGDSLYPHYLAWADDPEQASALVKGLHLQSVAMQNDIGLPSPLKDLSEITNAITHVELWGNGLCVPSRHFVEPFFIVVSAWHRTYSASEPVKKRPNAWLLKPIAINLAQYGPDAVAPVHDERVTA